MLVSRRAASIWYMASILYHQRNRIRLHPKPDTNPKILSKSQLNQSLQGNKLTSENLSFPTRVSMCKIYLWFSLYLHSAVWVCLDVFVLYTDPLIFSFPQWLNFAPRNACLCRRTICLFLSKFVGGVLVCFFYMVASSWPFWACGTPHCDEFNSLTTKFPLLSNVVFRPILFWVQIGVPIDETSVSITMCHCPCQSWLSATVREYSLVLIKFY
jgi:hypothetical protein